MRGKKRDLGVPSFFLSLSQSHVFMQGQGVGLCQCGVVSIGMVRGHLSVDREGVRGG